jgi:hypothetical protein
MQVPVEVIGGAVVACACGGARQLRLRRFGAVNAARDFCS